jgi:hypothetical protein
LTQNILQQLSGTALTQEAKLAVSTLQHIFASTVAGLCAGEGQSSTKIKAGNLAAQNVLHFEGVESIGN